MLIALLFSNRFANVFGFFSVNNNQKNKPGNVDKKTILRDDLIHGKCHFNRQS